MDWKVSRKEKVPQPDGSGAKMVLVDDIFDIYPVFGNALDQTQITDVELITDPVEELLDRAMFAIVKQYGADPCEVEDGIQWAEAIIGEAPAALVLLQVQNAVQKEGPTVTVTPQITPRGTSFTVDVAR